jgi:hypothetical protein
MTTPTPKPVRCVEFRPEGRPYVIRPAKGRAELDAVHRLTHDSIVAGGYMVARPDGRLDSYPTLDASPLTTVLVAVCDGTIIGTNSLTADGPLGLHTDLYFPTETNAVRRDRRRLTSSFRIATAPTVQDRHGYALILDLVKWTLVVATEAYDFETMLCTFNPKHETVYRRMLAATTLAHQAQVAHGDVNAGAVLMRIDVDRLPAALAAEVAQLRRSVNGAVAAPPLQDDADLPMRSVPARSPSVAAAAVRHPLSISATESSKRVGR